MSEVSDELFFVFATPLSPRNRPTSRPHGARNNPNRIPIDSRKISGRRRPNRLLQRSLTEPRMGDTKNAMSGLSAQTIVMCLCSMPIERRIGDTKAVSALYANSMPVIMSESRMSSSRDFFLLLDERLLLSKWIIMSVSSHLNTCE